MLISATTWFVYVLIFAAGALLLGRTVAVIGFVVATVIALPAALLPLSNCAPWRPSPGDYTVLGARIDMPYGSFPGAIWAFLDAGDGEPRCYKLPFSTAKANDLQEALDGEGRIKVTIGGGGGKNKPGDGSEGEAYDGEPPVTADENKTSSQQPIATIPG